MGDTGPGNTGTHTQSGQHCMHLSLWGEELQHAEALVWASGWSTG